MKQWNPKAMEDLVKREGSKSKAALRIVEVLGCSISKAEKMAANRYGRRISDSEYEKLVNLFEPKPRQRRGKQAS